MFSKVYQSMIRSSMVALLSLTTIACGGGPIMIGGRVISDTGVPVSKAEINTIPATDITTTDDSGTFVLRRTITSGGEENIKPGVYKIIIKKSEYEDYSTEVNAQKGNVWTNDHIMKKQQLQFEEVAPDKTEEQKITNGNTNVPNQGI
jgi:hypothetical protein